MALIVKAVQIGGVERDSYVRIMIAAIVKGEAVSLFGRGGGNASRPVDLSKYFISAQYHVLAEKTDTRPISRGEFILEYNIGDKANALEQSYRFLKQLYVNDDKFVRDDL